MGTLFSSSFARDVLAVSPLWILALGAAAVMLLGVTPLRGCVRLLFLSSLVILSLSLWQLLGAEKASTWFHGAVRFDAVTQIFGVVLLLGAMVSLVLVRAYVQEQALSAAEFFALLLLGSCGALMLIMAGDLMTLFIGLEAMSLAVYVLAGYRRAALRSQEAAFKYFIYGAFASSFVLFGMALIYGEMGRLLGVPSLSLEALAQAFVLIPAQGSMSVTLLCAVLMILAGLGFKIAWVPFHMWTPDVYEGAPIPATAFMAVAVKTGAFAALCRFVFAVLPQGTDAAPLQGSLVHALEVFAMLSMVVGNVLALRQRSIKRMLAYSSVAHAGYLLVGVIAAAAASSEAARSQALDGLGYYLLSYAVMTAGALGVVLFLEYKSDRHEDLLLERLSSLGRQQPLAGLAMAICMLGLAGIPPAAGFFAKFTLFAAAVSTGHVAVVVVAVLASMVGAYYYLRVLVILYMQSHVGAERFVGSRSLQIALCLCAACTVALGVLPRLYFDCLRAW